MSLPENDDPMVSTDWLAERLGSPGLVIIDATWFMPGTARDARAEHAERHIPGAVFFDIDEIADHANPLPHMLPDPAEFAVHARRLGVEPDSQVVVYDSQGLFSAPRVWWMFRVMGHDQVAVLDGGLPKWMAEDHPVEQGWPQNPHGEFKSHFDAGMVRDLATVLGVVETHAEQIVDARAAARFFGQAPEPRAGLRSGHMPGALSLPSSQVVTSEGMLAPRAALEALFIEAGVDLDRPVLTSCGSGISAAILSLALARLGRWRTPVYDGSWTEWGGLADTPVVTA
jgi:thiosulfate/3-mercaptopyruvate sulfurtransferase